MKKLLTLLLALVLVLSLAACGSGDDEKTPASNDEKTPSSSQQQEDKTPEADPVEDEPEENQTSGDDYELLIVLGLENAVPKSYTSFENRYDDVSSYDCEYYFTVPVAGDGNTERMEYTNQVLEAVLAISDDGKAYENTIVEKDGAYVPGWVEAAPRTEGVEADYLPAFYFYKDGMVLVLYIYDYGSDSEHDYNIVISKEADDYIQMPAEAGGEDGGAASAASAGGVPEGWPENEYTKLVPTPNCGGTISKSAEIGELFAIELEWTMEQGLTYAKLLQDAGFGEDCVETYEKQGYLDRTANGVNVQLMDMMGITSISIMKAE